MKKKDILDAYIKKHQIPDFILNKINLNSFLTENYAYGALRIGNSIGDVLDISIEIILLEEIARKYDLIVDTTEHAELHTKVVSEKDISSLIKGAVLFENIKHNKKRYKQTLKEISDYIREEVCTIMKNHDG